MSKRLVAYFAASGVTAKVAENLADAIPDREPNKDGVVFVHVITLGGDDRARGRIAHFDSAAGFLIHPVQIGFSVRNFRLNLKNVCTDSIAPTIINTFLESYNLKGKTVIPFATSGGSGMGKTNEKLTPSCPGAKLLHGKVFNSYSSKADLSAWVETLSL